jgi:peptidoglycan LD-endopeptidase CwlK
MGFPVLLLSIFLYFSLAVLLMGLFIFPPFRHAVLQRLQQSWAAMGTGLAQISKRSGNATTASGGLLRNLYNGLVHFIQTHRKLALLGLVVMAIPPIVALLLHNNLIFEFEDDVREPDPQIAALLMGERLVPPPPLPPAVFVTREVEQIRPAARYASRDWNFLESDFRQRLLLIFKIMREQHGYEMALIEGYRSPERQDQLAALGDHVTKAGAFMSFHQYGMAADNGFYRNGILVLSEKDPWAMRGYELYGQVAESVGLTWGGRWKLSDLGHIELKKPGVLGRKS